MWLFWFRSRELYAKKLQKLLKIYEKQRKNRKALISITDWISIKMNKKEREWNTICPPVNQRVPGSSPGLGARVGRRSILTSFSFLHPCKTLLALSKTSIGFPLCSGVITAWIIEPKISGLIALQSNSPLSIIAVLLFLLNWGISVSGLAKVAIYTTNVDAENQTLNNRKCVSGALNRHFCQTRVSGSLF